MSPKDAKDERGMPARHSEASDFSEHNPDYKGPALARHAAAQYTEYPLMPKPVKDAKAKMDEAAELVRELDEAAFGIMDEYRSAPREAQRKAHEAVAAGDTPESTEVLDKELDSLAREYKDALAHRKAVEIHLVTLVDRYHEVAEKHLPVWRDAVAKELHKRAEPARIALAKATGEARTVYGLASAVEAMDRPRMKRGERPMVSALQGKDVPLQLQVDNARGKKGPSYFPDTSKVFDAMDGAGMLASTYLRVEGNAQLGQGAIPEVLVTPVADMPEHDPEADRAENEHRREQLARARQMGMSDKRAQEFFGF